jgi:hypothetical protein
MPFNEINSRYAILSIILRASGSVGVTFVMRLLGATIAAAGTAVYIELGTVRDINCSLSCLTRIYAGLGSGGEKNYLEFTYPRPTFLITCIYAVYAFLTARTLSAFGQVCF